MTEVPAYVTRRRSKRVKGIEPSSLAWKAMALPLSYTRSELHPQAGSELHPQAVGPFAQFSMPVVLADRDHPASVLVSIDFQSRFLNWGVQDSNLRRQCHQIYSLTPLTARETPLSLRDRPVRLRDNSSTNKWVPSNGIESGSSVGRQLSRAPTQIARQLKSRRPASRSSSAPGSAVLGDATRRPRPRC